MRWRRSQRWLRNGTFVALLPSAWVALALGWASGPRAWPIATGWERIPLEQRPADGAIWRQGGEAPEIRWLGHSGFVLRWGGQTLLVDPNTSEWCTVSRRCLEPAGDLSLLGPVDAALLSHAHFDHLDKPTLRSIQGLQMVVTPSGSETEFGTDRWPELRTVALGEYQSLAVGPLEVVAVPAAHNGGRLHPLKSSRQAIGYVIRNGRDAVYYAGDTGRGAPFADIARQFRPRVAILPIGAYSPRFPLAAYHLTPEEAVAVAVEMGVETVLPCHFGTFRLSFDRPDAALPRFARAAHAEGVRWVMPLLWRAQGGVERLGDSASLPGGAASLLGGAAQ